jgi:hypothetical protein
MMDKAVETVVGLIFALIVMFILLMVTFTFLLQFFEATPEQKALRDLADGIQLACEPSGGDSVVQPVPINLPNSKEGVRAAAYYDLHLQSDGIVQLRSSPQDCDNNPGCRTQISDVIEKKPDCPAAIEYKECFIEPEEGRESILVRVVRERTLISLEENEQVRCE